MRQFLKKNHWKYITFTKLQKFSKDDLSRSLLSLLCSLLFFNLQAQITTSQILASAKKDAIFQLKNEQTDLLRNNPLVLPNWDDVEFRMSSDGFKLNENTYALRMTRNPKGLIRQQERVYNSLLQVTDIESVIEFSGTLENRYEAILQSKFSEDVRTKRNELVLVLEDQKRAIGNRLALGLDNDLEDLADIDEELQDEALIAFEFDFYKKQLSKQIAEWTAIESKNIEQSNFISIEKMKLIVAEIQSASILNHPEIRRRALRSDFAMQEELFEKREEQMLLNYLQVRYSEDDDPDELFREKISVGMGMRLGTKRIKNLRSQELEVERLEAEKEVEIQKVDLEKDFAEAVIEWNFLVEKLEFLKMQFEEFQLKYAPEIFLSKGITNPMTLLNAKETLLKKEILINKTSFELYEKYLDLLFLSGKPVELPMRNFLAESLEEF